MKKLLHIAAHLGGGAGKAITGILTELTQYENTLILLENPVSRKYYDICIESGINIIICPDNATISALAADSDAVIVNWWGHPLFLNVFKVLNNIDTRLVLWSHINGLHYPYLPFDFVNLFDICMFTSPCTYENDYWNCDESTQIKNNSRIVYGMGDFTPQSSKYKENYTIKNKLKIGYTGTLSFNKLNSAFPQICRDVKSRIPSVEFELYGNYTGEFKELFDDHVIFKGFENNIEAKLPEMDIFCYPLTEENYATTENALLEAMAAGLPIVVLNNPPERNIISHNENGLVAADISEFTDYICRLYENISLRNKLGQSARESVIKKYSFEKNFSEFSKCIESALARNKSAKNFAEFVGDTAWDFFQYFAYRDFDKIQKLLDGESAAGIPQIYFEENKSSIRHFYRLFPDDENFRKVLNVL